MEQIGTVFVDAGIVMVGDPCYTLPDDASHRTEVAKNWSKFCDASYDENGKNVTAPLGQGIAVVVPSGYGDGEYPVFVERSSDGTVLRLIVEFEHPNGRNECCECGDEIDGSESYCWGCEPEDEDEDDE
jgi:hypothetical protein